ncbi:hypothetical protein AV530_015511 [Patagioenas fasciata monilis]|uniref:Uncharacterized protein n=1 Tax=Patagioenas fasciata monilis TaxID=372326 RepID=A0A1V4KRV3_PATFA|nr:hypothetical protein AV530_015511 [Patagioenas fasciata monilis]
MLLPTPETHLANRDSQPARMEFSLLYSCLQSLQPGRQQERSSEGCEELKADVDRNKQVVWGHLQPTAEEEGSSSLMTLATNSQSHHWASEAGHLLKSLLKLAPGFKRKDIYSICASHLEFGQKSKQYPTACSIKKTWSTDGITPHILRAYLARC